MNELVLLITIAFLAIISYFTGSFRASKFLSKKRTETAPSVVNLKKSSSSSLKQHFGYCITLWTLFPTLVAGYFFYNKKVSIFPDSTFVSQNLGSLIVFFFIMLIISYLFIGPSFRAREHSEKWVKWFLTISATVSISITVLIFLSVLFESIKFFEKISMFDFFFGLEWSPQTALRADQAGSSGKFGIIPVFTGTFLITLIAMLVAVPLGLLSAIYLTEYSSSKFRTIAKPALEILAGIPTVVYGYFAAITLGPLLRDLMGKLNIDIASESALAAGFVMGIMIIPYMMSLADDVMNAVPRALRDASLGLGATKSETIKKVVIPAALPGIIGAFLLAASRAIGETMIVVMAAGLIAKLTLNPFESVTTVTAQIVKLLVGDQEFDSAKTLAAFSLSLTLFLITLILNVVAIMIVKKYREKYD